PRSANTRAAQARISARRRAFASGPAGGRPRRPTGFVIEYLLTDSPVSITAEEALICQGNQLHSPPPLAQASCLCCLQNRLEACSTGKQGDQLHSPKNAGMPSDRSSASDRADSNRSTLLEPARRSSNTMGVSPIRQPAFLQRYSTSCMNE